MPVQAKNQVKAFGKPSEMIRDYTERKLVPIPDTSEARKLWTMIDPWVYRDKLTLPEAYRERCERPLLAARSRLIPTGTT